jgi:hypothetical protein
MTTSFTPVSDAPLSQIPFTPRAEASILELSKWMRISGVIGILASVLKLCVAVFIGHGLGSFIGAVVTFLVGFWSYQAGNEFASMATTNNADQRHLMDGFGLLRRVFLLQAAMIILAFALFGAAIVGGIIVAATR